MQTDRYKQVIVHCGLPKTGSSFLQRLFLHNTSHLARHSIHYPAIEPSKRHQGNHSIAFITYSAGEDFAVHIAKRLDLESECDTLLLSAEGFAKPALQAQAADRLVALFPNAKVRFIFYLRRFDHIIESVYSEVVKVNFCGSISEVFYPTNVLAKLDPFVRAVGKPNIVIRPYSKALWPNGSIGADFFAAIGRPEVWQDVNSLVGSKVNAMLSRPAIHLLSRTPIQEKRSVLKRISSNPTILPKDPARYFRSPSDRRRFNNTFDAHYRQVVQEFELGNVREFFDLERYDDDPLWAPFSPDVKAMKRALRPSIVERLYSRAQVLNLVGQAN
ncbi:hypothetical protein [Mesorhizobium xinjiangense]|uniref:hypothetical protein n=1 Tax=Mesorhizobium xinjiangense TaxID=2678685 RepID=UPI0012ECF078|nr:hypothetical protein [Mesorhizobium xinjiangense]